MKLWTSGEIDAGIGEVFRKAMNEVEHEVNTMLSTFSNATGIESWDVIYIISSAPSKEKIRYNSREKETDIRIVVNLKEFEGASQLERKGLLIDALIKSIYLITDKYKISNFNPSEIINGLTRIKSNAIGC